MGSRDINKCDHSYCSSVCCMYAIKQAVIAKEHSDKTLDTAIFFMDMRTYGKDFERYYTGAPRMRRRPLHPVPHSHHRCRPTTTICGSHYVTEDGTIIEEEIFDMVVLSVGLSPEQEAVRAGRQDSASNSTTTTSPRPPT